MRILMRRDSSDPTGRWETLEPLDYERESVLQELLRTHATELFPPDPANDSHVVYAREFYSAAGPIDLVGIGSSGSITVMECKLAYNPQIRREVVAQLLDYASALWGMDPPAFVAEFKRVATDRADPFVSLQSNLADDSNYDETACR